MASRIGYHASHEQFPPGELLALVQHHSASTQETKDRAAKLQDELIAELPPEVVAAAKARGKERTFESVATEILAGEP